MTGGDVRISFALAGEGRLVEPLRVVSPIGEIGALARYSFMQNKANFAVFRPKTGVAEKNKAKQSQFGQPTLSFLRRGDNTRQRSGLSWGGSCHVGLLAVPCGPKWVNWTHARRPL